MAQHRYSATRAKETVQKRPKISSNTPQPTVATKPASPNALPQHVLAGRGAAPTDILALQRVAGNQNVSRLIQPKSSEQEAAGDGGGIAASQVEAGIQQARGGGQPLSDDVRGSMEGRFGADFSGVRIHTGAQADALNRSLQARAFTTGQDIFLREGEYSPGSSQGQKLLAHELTHTIQQTGGSQQVSRQTLVQRVLDPTASRALNKAIETGGGQPYTKVKDTLKDEESPFSPEFQKQIVHLWSGFTKFWRLFGRKQDTKAELNDRLDYVRAFLLKTGAETYRGWTRMLKKSPEEARQKVMEIVNNKKTELKAVGLTKAGAISPELNKLLNQSSIIKGAGTQVDGPRIEIHGTYIPGMAKGLAKFLGRRHSQIVFTDEEANRECLSAGQGSAREEGGSYLEAEDPAYYGPDDEDYDAGAQKKILEVGDQTRQKWENIKQAAKTLTARKLPYRLLTQNCNTAAAHLLTTAGVANIKAPGAGYIGWGNRLTP